MNLLDSAWNLFLCSATANDSPMWGASSSVSLLNSTRYAAASWQVSRCLGLGLRTTSNPPTTHCAKGRFLGSSPAASGTSQPELLPIIPGLLPIIVAHVTVVQGLDVPGGRAWRNIIAIPWSEYLLGDIPTLTNPGNASTTIYYLCLSYAVCFFVSNHSSLLNNPNPDVFLLVFLTNMCLKIRHIFIYTHTVNISYLHIIPQMEWHPVGSMSPYFSPFNIVSFQLAMFFHGQYPTGKPGRQSRQSSASLEVFTWSRNL